MSTRRWDDCCAEFDATAGAQLHFDVYDWNRNTAVYDKLFRRAVWNRTGTKPLHRGSELPYLRSTLFRELRERNAVDGTPAALSNWPLATGDGFIVRQPEVHRTDRHELREGQWRLALGFKVLERRPLDGSRYEFGPVSQDLAQFQLRYPGLIPPIQPGQPFPASDEAPLGP